VSGNTELLNRSRDLISSDVDIRLKVNYHKAIFNRRIFFISLYFSLPLSSLYLYSRENETAGAVGKYRILFAESNRWTTFTFLVPTVREIQMGEIDVGSQRSRNAVTVLLHGVPLHVGQKGMAGV